MNRRVVIAALIAGLVIVPTQRAHAQAAPGNWQVQIGEWASDAGAGVIQMRMGNTADLTVTSNGDSVTAIFQPATDGGTVRADTLRGQIVEGKLKVSGNRRLTARMNRNGEESSSEAVATITIDLAPAGETLTGTIRFEMPGRMNVYAPLTARRTDEE
jgi:hypothetical protein